MIPGLQLEVREQPYVCVDGMLYLGDADELICRVTACGIARAQFHRWEWHQGLVAEGWTAKGLHAHRYAFLYQRMCLRNAR